MPKRAKNITRQKIERLLGRRIRKSAPKNNIFLVTELCQEGELFDYIVQKGQLTEDEARNIFAQILSAVEHAHSLHVVHRDLKTENVLLDENLTVKLADFGFGQFYEEGKLLNTWCGR